VEEGGMRGEPLIRLDAYASLPPSARGEEN
jgi:hypothetical protein